MTEVTHEHSPNLSWRVPARHRLDAMKAIPNSRVVVHTLAKSSGVNGPKARNVFYLRSPL